MLDWQSEKIKPYGPSVFDSIGQMAREYDCVNLGQGFPDFDGPEEIKAFGADAICNGYNQYSPLPGMPELNEAVRDKYRRFYNLDYDPKKEITITNGATEAMYATIMAICNPGDRFVVFEPVYDTYVPLIQMCGGTVVPVPLEAPSFRFDPDRLKRAFEGKIKGIIVNTPHNPCGTVFHRGELELIRDLCVAADCMAITDEVYEHLVFDGSHIPLASLDGMRERTVTISSTAKSFSYTGWKIGYALAPEAASVAIRRIHQFVCFCVATPLQTAMSQAIARTEEFVEPLQQDLGAKRDMLCANLKKAGFKPTAPEGTYFVLADFSELSDLNDVEFTLELIRSEVVATIPISGFYVNRDAAPRNYLRFCFAKRQATLDAAVERLGLLRRK